MMLPTKHHLRLLLKTVAVLAAIFLVITITLIIHVLSQFDGNGTLPTECTVVFGAAVHKNNVSGPGIERRVDTAARYYAEGFTQTLFFTGGKGAEELDSEAQVMQRRAMLQGVEPENIVLEEKATSTWENLLFTRPLIEEYGCTRVVGISDRYHLARIQYLASKQGWENLRTLPAGEHPSFFFETRAVLREALGIVYYFLRDYVPVEKIVAP